MADQQQDQQEHPPEKKTTTRRATLSTQNKSKTAQASRRGQVQVEQNGEPVQDYVSCYANLPWDVLHGYIETIFPGWDFRESQKNDSWTFVVPRKLTPDERLSITALRDSSEKTEQGSSKRRPSVSDSE